jgi:tetratricopeptide (TPR) repeat protein/transglutaminase-like putative cysteine protease
MRRFVTMLTCLLVFYPVCVAQQLPSPAVSVDSAATSPDQKRASKYPQEPFVIEKYSTTARYENDGTGERDLNVQILVQSDAGVQQLGELVFGYNSANEQMDVHYVRVRKADGTFVHAGPEAVKEMTASLQRDAPVYTDYKEKHITVPSLRPGDTLEYEITTRLVTPLAPGQFWFSHDFQKDAIVLDEQLKVDVPKKRELKVAAPRLDYISETNLRRTVYTWKYSNLAHPSDDSSKDTSREPKAPDVQLTTFASWEGIAQWYAKLEQDRVQPDAQIRAKADELTKGRATEVEKIQALYDYVSKNIRYVSLSFGLGRYQPHAAAEVLANQYGDCKDKQTLLASMLEAVGIHADAVLISSARKLDVSLPSPAQFDHVITVVPQGSELIWLDSTAEVAPYRFLPSPLRNKYALLVPSDGAGKIVETPADPPFPSNQRVEIVGQVSELGKLTAKLSYSLRGDTEFVLRSAFRRTPETQWKELGQTILTLDGLHGEVSVIKPSDPSDTQNPFQLEIEFSQPNYLDWSSKKAKAPLPLVTLGMPSVADDNANQIELGSPLLVTTTLKLALPATLAVQPPVAISVSRDYADFKSSYEFEEHALTAERSLNFKLRELPASRTSDYLAFTHAVESDEGQSFAVENTVSGAPTIPATAKPEELVDAAYAALNGGNPEAAIPLLQRAVELEPKHKLAWNYLGLAYLRLGKFDDAAGAFRKQIEINPYDEYAYNELGVTLQQQQKFTEAIAAYQKQIEVNPLDNFAHAALGSLYLTQHKYAEAVPELDKATVLSPDNAEIEVELGQAYLNTGEKEKALAAFEKGIDIAKTPVVWNNVAYSLADHKIELDKAQQYSESAISATAANLRNVELSRLTLDDLGQVQSIGSYWDTLGWVYFQKGDLTTSEKYIRASWMLSQYGEVGDHLAQIYEKRGERDQAIHTYAFAMATAHTIPETRGRLASLLGDNNKIAGIVDAARGELTSLRTIPAGRMLNEKASADFFLSLTPGGNGTNVAAVRFISGSEKLRLLADRLRSLDYGVMFPDSSPIKLVRRGTLSCDASRDCTLTLVLPEDVRTLN